MHTCGIAKLAMVRPETTSALRRLSLYSEAHWKIGKTYWRPRMTFLKKGWFLNWWRGSSGKKTSFSSRFRDWMVVFFWGKETLWISKGGMVEGGRADSRSATSGKLSTLLLIPTIAVGGGRRNQVKGKPRAIE